MSLFGPLFRSSYSLLAFLLLHGLLGSALAGRVAEHGQSFHPDYVLRITEETVPIACQLRKSVLVNGTSPGPEIRLKPGSTTWIRVYNDMDALNTTMVRRLAFCRPDCSMLMHGLPALARLSYACCILG